MSENGARRRRRVLSPEAKWEIFLEGVSREVTQGEAARRHGVDVSTIIGIRRTVKDGALAALAALVARPGRRAKERNWERCEADPDLRSGYKTPTHKRPQEKYSGFATHTGATTTYPTDDDDDDDDAHVPTYITAVKTTAANADAAPIANVLAERTRDIANRGLHLVQDMDFSRKLDTYVKPRRRRGDQVHMNFPAPATRTADKPICIKRRDGTESTIVVSCGAPFHEHTSKELLALPARLFMPGREKELATRLELRHHWCWDVIGYDPKTGNIRLRCPHCAGKIFDVTGRLPASSRQRGNALPVEFPDDVTECCPGTITVTIEHFPTFQNPAYGTPAHTKIMNQRNAVESPFGIARDKGGLEPGSCKAARLEAHALAALTTFVVMNLQTTMDQEIKEVQELLKQHRQQQATHGDALADRAEVVETDGAEPAEAAQPDDGAEPAEAAQPDDEAEPAEAAQPDDEAEPAEAAQPDDEAEPAEAAQPDDGAEPAEAAQPDDEAEPADDVPTTDPQEQPQAVTLKPNDGGGSATTIDKRPRPPP